MLKLLTDAAWQLCIERLQSRHVLVGERLRSSFRLLVEQDLGRKVRCEIEMEVNGRLQLVAGKIQRFCRALEHAAFVRPAIGTKFIVKLRMLR